MSKSTSQSASSAPSCGPAPDERSRWFAEEVYAHNSQLKSYLRGSFPSVRDVDDVVQDSYLRLWKARAAQPIVSAKAFLFKVARHRALDSLRRGRTSSIVAMPDLSDLNVIAEEPNSAEIACTNEEIALLAEVLDGLQPRCREIIILRKFQNIPQKEVAERLGISELTVQEQVYRGLRRMEKALTRRGVIRPWYHE